MRKYLLSMMLVASTSGIQAIEINDSLHLQEVVVTGTRSATDTRYLPQTVTVIERDLLTNQYQKVRKIRRIPSPMALRVSFKAS